jgi:hypothetical protein
MIDRYQRPNPQAVRVGRRRRTSTATAVADGAGVVTGVFAMVWDHKLWWVVPLLLSLLAIGGLLLVESTPVGPLIYPVF